MHAASDDNYDRPGISDLADQPPIPHMDPRLSARRIAELAALQARLAEGRDS